MTKIFQLHPLAKIVRYSARVHGIPELGLYKGRFAALKADITFSTQLNHCFTYMKNATFRSSAEHFHPSIIHSMNNTHVSCKSSVYVKSLITTSCFSGRGDSPVGGRSRGACEASWSCGGRCTAWLVTTSTILAIYFTLSVFTTYLHS